MRERSAHEGGCGCGMGGSVAHAGARALSTVLLSLDLVKIRTLPALDLRQTREERGAHVKIPDVHMHTCRHVHTMC